MTDRAHFAEILDAYLAALETGNPPDREALLARHPELAEDLRAALLGIDVLHGAAPRLAPEEEGDALPGGMLGDYRLLRELGRGGMAVVYEAEQVSLGRHVALKVLPFAAVLDPKQLQRFKNEAMAAAHLRHPNIVPVYGVGCERGVHYYAMQYVEGQSLATAIRGMKRGGGSTGDGPKTPISSHGSIREPAYIRMAAALGVQAAEALDHAHQLGIVHRDVKPGNLLADLNGTLWVTDFGLASSKKDVGLTITGELLGTIRYMSPEQALAKRVPVDHRTDVYSLGATLYELLTLEPAFPGDDPGRVIHDIAIKEPVLPRRLNPALPRDIETVILKAMWKDPSGRYATAQEMADDLTRFLENRPIEAKRPGLLRRASKWGRRHRVLVGAAAGMLLLALAGLGTGTALLWREKERTTKALTRSEANLLLARNAVDKFLVETGIDQFRDEPLPAAAKRALLETAISFYETYGDDPASSYNRASILHALHRYEDALAVIARELDSRPRDAGVLTARGHMLYHLGRYDDALVALDSAIAIDDNVGVQLHVYRGHVLASLGRLAEALAAHRQAVRIAPTEANARQALGKTLFETGQVEESVTEFREAVRLDADDPLAHSNLAAGLVVVGDLDGAIRAYLDAIRLDSDFAAAHFFLGNALLKKRDNDGAKREYLATIRLRPDDLAAHFNLGNALFATGEMQGAAASYREAIRRQPDSAEFHYALANTLAKGGDPERAIEEFHEAIRIRPDYAEAYCNLGHALMRLGRFEEAVPCLRRGHELGSKRADWAYPSEQWIEDAERKADPEGRLDPLLSDEARPTDALERVEYAVALYTMERHAESARMYADAFADDAALAEDLAKGHRYSAACSAALAAAPGGLDAAESRGRALQWLRADVAAREKAATGLAATLERWKKEPDFASVRDRIDDLPESERAAWRDLWDAVDHALAAALPTAK